MLPRWKSGPLRVLFRASSCALARSGASAFTIQLRVGKVRSLSLVTQQQVPYCQHLFPELQLQLLTWSQFHTNHTHGRFVLWTPPVVPSSGTWENSSFCCSAGSFCFVVSIVRQSCGGLVSGNGGSFAPATTPVSLESSNFVRGDRWALKWEASRCVSLWSTTHGTDCAAKHMRTPAVFTAVESGTTNTSAIVSTFRQSSLCISR